MLLAHFDRRDARAIVALQAAGSPDAACRQVQAPVPPEMALHFTDPGAIRQPNFAGLPAPIAIGDAMLSQLRARLGISRRAFQEHADRILPRLQDAADIANDL